VGTSKTHANICETRTYVHDCMYEMKTPCTYIAQGGNKKSRLYGEEQALYENL